MRDLTGRNQAKAARRTGKQTAAAALEAADILQAGGREAIGETRAGFDRATSLLDPLAGVGQRGIDESGFLADPQAQFDFLQENPLFQLALENANEQTLQGASAGKRLSFGDTLQQLSNNVLLSASPLIDRQREDIGNLLNLSQGVTGQQVGLEREQTRSITDLITDIANAEAAGQVGEASALGAGRIGAANAKSAGSGNILDFIIQAASAAAGVPTGGGSPFGGGSGGAPNVLSTFNTPPPAFSTGAPPGQFFTNAFA